MVKKCFYISCTTVWRNAVHTHSLSLTHTHTKHRDTNNSLYGCTCTTEVRDEAAAPHPIKHGITYAQPEHLHGTKPRTQCAHTSKHAEDAG